MKHIHSFLWERNISLPSLSERNFYLHHWRQLGIYTCARLLSLVWYTAVYIIFDNWGDARFATYYRPRYFSITPPDVYVNQRGKELKSIPPQTSFEDWRCNPVAREQHGIKRRFEQFEHLSFLLYTCLSCSTNTERASLFYSNYCVRNGISLPSDESARDDRL